MSRQLKPCGTHEAYRRHLRRREVTCAECLAAEAEYRRRLRGTEPRTPDPCGTIGAYQRHTRRREAPCEACAAAWRLYQWAAKAQRKAVA